MDIDAILDSSMEKAELFVKLRTFLNLNVGVDSEAVFYALAECIQDRIDIINLTPDKKGDILHSILFKLEDANFREIAMARSIMAFERQATKATIH